MQRRDFLKLVGLAAVAPSLPASEADPNAYNACPAWKPKTISAGS